MKLLSPAGDFESLKMAVFYGADEVYLGVKDFNARNIEGFSLTSLREAVDFAHVYGVKVHLAVNILFSNSELQSALDLVERGHRLVADDIVEIRCVNGNTILGQGANSLISHHMEIRGLGIINVSELYGVGAIREQKEIQLIVELEEWDSNKIYDRIGTNQRTMDLLGVKIPAIEIPVKPGRNLPIIIEAAAMNERLKKMGYNSAKDFNQNVLKWIETGEAQAAYYGQDDIY